MGVPRVDQMNPVVHEQSLHLVEAIIAGQSMAAGNHADVRFRRSWRAAGGGFHILTLYTVNLLVCAARSGGMASRKSVVNMDSSAVRQK